MRAVVPDLTQWKAYCDNCTDFRTVRAVEMKAAVDPTVYYEFICVECSSIVLTLQPL